jgi:hypothetical protein
LGTALLAENCAKKDSTTGFIRESVQLALARQDAKERESSDDGEAGGMTATARADIGARFQARPKSVGLGLRTDV